ncbi:MAG TPA: alpha/beta hydrolase, partial [Micromonosporaceae bacterium]
MLIPTWNPPGPGRKAGVGFVVATLTLAGLAACTSAGHHSDGSSAGSPATSAGGSGSSATVAAASREVSFVVDGTTTYATLQIPAHSGGQRLAAALLIAGSGPTDRNGNDAGLGVTADTLELVAGLLAQQGIMSLRYDKYFAGKTGAGAFSSDPASITMPAFVTQAVAAYEFMGRQPEADPAKLLVVGHSEGGMVALAVAEAAATKPAGLALLEPQDERLLDLLELQIDENISALVAQGTLPTDQARRNRQAVATAIRQFRAERAVATSGMAAQVVALLRPILLAPDTANFARTDDAIVPATLANKVTSGTRVLVTDGTRDQNVPISTVGPLVQTLTQAGATGPGLVTLPGTDHYLHLAN